MNFNDNWLFLGILLIGIILGIFLGINIMRFAMGYLMVITGLISFSAVIVFWLAIGTAQKYTEMN